jgi:hypothetical protein
MSACNHSLERVRGDEEPTFCSDFFSSGNAFFSLPSPKNSPSLVDLAALALAK